MSSHFDRIESRNQKTYCHISHISEKPFCAKYNNRLYISSNFDDFPPILRLFYSEALQGAPRDAGGYSFRKSRKIPQYFSASSCSSISQKIRRRGSVPEKRALTHPPFLKYTLQPSR